MGLYCVLACIIHALPEYRFAKLPLLECKTATFGMQNCHFWNAKLPLLETAPNCHSRLVYTPLLFVYLGQVFQFEYIDEWETSVSVSPSLLPTSSKYVCMHDFWP